MENKNNSLLDKFVDAQQSYYKIALEEIRQGCKQSHWMWYIFPQLRGLGNSWKSEIYSLENLEEATVYLQHPILGPRLIEISNALLDLPTNDPDKVMGYPDNLKLRSCMTLFSKVEGCDPVFKKVLNKYYSGKFDELTLKLLRKKEDK